MENAQDSQNVTPPSQPVTPATSEPKALPKGHRPNRSEQIREMAMKIAQGDAQPPTDQPPTNNDPPNVEPPKENSPNPDDKNTQGDDEKEKRHAERMAMVAKKERMARRIQEENKTIKQQLEELQSKHEEAKSLLEKAKEDPTVLGLSYEDIIERQISEINENPQKTAKNRAELKELQELRKEIQEFKTWRNEIEEEKAEQQKLRQQQDEQERESNFVDQLQKYIEKSGKFDLIELYGAHRDVYDEIVKHFVDTENEFGEGELISNEEACRRVEDRIIKRRKELAEREIKNQRIMELYGIKPPKTDSSSSPKPPVSQKTKTLTQRNQGPSSGAIPKDLSRKEKIQLMAEKIKRGELGS